MLEVALLYFLAGLVVTSVPPSALASTSWPALLVSVCSLMVVPLSGISLIWILRYGVVARWWRRLVEVCG